MDSTNLRRSTANLRARGPQKPIAYVRVHNRIQPRQPRALAGLREKSVRNAVAAKTLRRNWILSPESSGVLTRRQSSAVVSRSFAPQRILAEGKRL